MFVNESCCAQKPKWFILIFLLLIVIVLYVSYYNHIPLRQTPLFLPHTNFGSLSDDILFNKNISYVINPLKCTGHIFAILLVTSFAGDAETRSYVRRAYPEKVLKKLKIRRVFLLALMDEKLNHTVTQSAIVDEHTHFNDILQGSFIEHYRNLTYKHIMGLRWAANNCNNVQYVLKMDHDIAYNLIEVHKFLSKLPKKDFILAGYEMENMKPIRDPSSKWYVTDAEYSKNAYPNFLSGWFYVTNPRTSELIWQESQRMTYFWIDDTFTTGLVRQNLQLPLVKLNRYYTTEPAHLKLCMNMTTCRYWFGPNGGDNIILLQFARYSESHS